MGTLGEPPLPFNHWRAQSALTDIRAFENLERKERSLAQQCYPSKTKVGKPRRGFPYVARKANSTKPHPPKKETASLEAFSEEPTNNILASVEFSPPDERGTFRVTLDSVMSKDATFSATAGEVVSVVPDESAPRD